MESHDYPIEHFKMMAEIAVRLKPFPALILEHKYSYESYGSWWFTFKKAGETFRVVFDGRDNFLSLEQGVNNTNSKIIKEWKSLCGKQLLNKSIDYLVLEVCTLIDSEQSFKQ